jgi:hypothetical protein
VSVEPRRNLNPRGAIKDKWARIEALLRNREFVAEYGTHEHAGSPASRRPFHPVPTGSAALVVCALPQSPLRRLRTSRTDAALTDRDLEALYHRRDPLADRAASKPLARLLGRY